MFSKSNIVALLASFTSTALAVHPLKVQGSNFVNTVSGDRFEIIGVDYQPKGSAGYQPGTGIDPLSDATNCLRDAAIMQTLGLNTVRVYNLDPNVNHDECASILNAAGIYMVIDVNSPLPNESINNFAPWESYNDVYLNRTFAIIENFKNYPNLLGFFAANEVINDNVTAKIDPPYIRAVVRDLKSYIAKNSQRSIPVGYSAADVRPILTDTAAYLECHLSNDDSDLSRIDFFGLNSYSWCGDATYESSTYSQLVDLLSETTVPVFFSEFGCNKVEPRTWGEIGALYANPMRSIFSGGLVYEFSEEPNNFGLVQIHGNGTASLLQDFDNLQTAINKLDIKAVNTVNTTSTSLKPPTCNSKLVSDGQGFDTNFTLPVTPSKSEALISSGIKNPLNGKIVQVKSTAVPMAVYATNGQPLQNLAIKVLSNDDTNTPGTNTAASASVPSSPSSTGSAPAATSSGAGSAMEVGRIGALVAAGLAFIAAL